MDHVANRDLDRRSVDGKHQPTAGGEVDRDPDKIATGTLDPHLPTEGCRTPPQLVSHEVDVAQQSGQSFEQHRQHVVAVGGAAARSQRRCTLDRRRRDVETETDHDARRCRGDVLAQQPRKLAGGIAMFDHKIIGPLDPGVDASCGHRLMGGNRNRPWCDLEVVVDRRSEAEHQLTRTVVLPAPIEPAATR